MIRTLWVVLVIGATTAWFGTRVIFASLFGRRDGAWYVRQTRAWARAIMRASGCPVVVHGMENVKAGQAQVIASNHVSSFDIFALASVLEVPFHFVAKKELERIPLFGSAWKAAGHVSIDRSDRQRAIRSLREAGEKIRRDRSAVIIYPEGTRSRTGRLLPFKKGAFMLAIESGVPVVPTVVAGSFEIMPPGEWGTRPRPIHLHFLEPIVPPAGPGHVEELMERVRASMLTVLGPGGAEQAG